ncbi:Serendipity locus protein alpha [Operophtera brumata]|uniref:Serendipity locus protein alpha n=1 Tax=Operophtera brumata TaxID=104452 RepID=A0A0L7LD12_OPEBR|nr:Serendipity locus protein alpha [Operophtera brumata]
MEDNLCDSLKIPEDPGSATKHLLDKLLNEIRPIINGLRNKIQDLKRGDGDSSKINEVYSLCLSQITKCLLNLFDIFRLEYSRGIVLQNYSESNKSANESFDVTTMSFVNWIDHAFQNLNKLSDVVYKTDYKDTEDLYEMWKNEMVECISGLHISVDELLLCAMTLFRYCLPGDQHIIKARCQVVLRETKALLSELVQGDVSSTIKATTDSLKLPVMPSNVNVTIDVLKDVLYVLETNTNTSLLGLLIHCFSHETSPVDVLKEHFNKGCSCVGSADGSEDCEFVKEFDLYNERLLQIGSNPLPSKWTSQPRSIRPSPSTGADDVTTQLPFHVADQIMEAGNAYRSSTVCSVISIGCVVLDFFNAYIQIEPDALTQQEKLLPLLSDLEKEQLYKRLRLLYTVVGRINTLLQPEEHDELYEEDEESERPKNVTHSIAKNGITYVNSPRKNNISRSMFARTYIRSSTRNFPLSKLTKHLHAKCTELNFSVQLDEMFNLSKNSSAINDGTFINKRLNKVRESSVLYNFSPIKNRSSMRKIVLNRHLQSNKELEDIGDNGVSARESLFNDNESLQLTEVLNEMHDMTSILSSPRSRKALRVDREGTNVLTINVNNQNATSKHVWNIPVNDSVGEMPFDDLPNVSNVTQPSNVTTIERITDLDFVEEKLNDLKLQTETNLI